MRLLDDLAERLSTDEGRALVGELFGANGAVPAAEALLTVAGEFGDLTEVCLVRVGSGVVVGFTMDDESRIVVKVHRPHLLDRLRSVLRAQVALGQAGLPVARPLITDPVPIGAGAAIVETWIDHGEMLDVRPRPRRQAVARSAFTISSSLHMAAFADLAPSWIGRYMPPHSPIFDFESTASGAEWIDAHADTALRLKADAERQTVGRVVVAHTDLRPENVRIAPQPDGPVVSAIYDLDSLATDLEPWLVGGIARAFSTNWSLDDPMLPTVDEITGFIDDYETERGAPFDAEERKLADAGVLHALAYSARCEHALFPDGEDAPWGPGWRSLLRAWATRMRN